MCRVCGDGSCRKGSRCRGYYYGVGSAESDARPSVSFQHTSYEGEGQHESSTAAFTSQYAQPPYETVMEDSESGHGMAGLNDPGPAYAAGGNYSPTMPDSSNNFPQWSPSTPVVQNNYGNRQITSYTDPRVSIASSSGVSISQTFPQPVQYQPDYIPSQTSHRNEVSYSQYGPTIAATSPPAGQGYSSYAEGTTTAPRQSYVPVTTQAGPQYGYSRNLRDNQTYGQQQEGEPPDPLPSSPSSQYTSQLSVPSPYSQYQESGRPTTGSYSGDLHPHQYDPYSTDSELHQSQMFQQPTGFHATNSLTASQMSPQPPPGFASPNGVPSYSDTQQFNSTPVSPSVASYDASTGSTSFAPSVYPGLCQHHGCLSDPRKCISYLREKDWVDHNNRTHNKRYPCRYNGGCSMVFGTKTDEQRHRIAFHKETFGAKEFNCEATNCQGNKRVFFRKDKLKEHNDRWHGPYYCHQPNCRRGYGHGFIDQAALSKHGRSHANRPM